MAATALCAMTATGVTQAGPAPEFAVFQGLEAVPDTELSHMRGRFVASGQVAYFGVDMTTTWHTPGGRAVESKLSLGFSTGANPKVRITPTVNFGDDAPADTGSANPLSGVRGATQVIQVGGHGNAVANDLQLRITRGGAPTDAGTPGTATQVKSGAGGITAAAGFLEDGLGVQVQVPGVGAAEQMLFLNGRGLGQSAALSGNFHALKNEMILDARFSGAPLPGNQHTLHSLKNLRDLRSAF